MSIENNTKPNIFKAAFARVWAVWGIVSFAATFLIIFIPSMATKLVKNPKGIWWFILIAKWWNTTWLYLVGCPLKVYGKEHFQKGETYIVTANHNSFLDVPLLCPFVPGANQTIAKDTFTKVPIFGWYYARGSVLVNRESVASRKRSFDLMKTALKQGFHMCIFPEGSRNRSDKPMGKFQDGAFKLSRDTKTSIIPCVIIGTAKATPIHEPLFLFPTPLQLHFLPPVAPENMTIEALKEKVFNVMQEFYINH
ncbi:lysophospholipid acyltransferase family protein [Parasediminibacterium sp. JCM 36343]|uniref:lysophospholipid acyltransferase family protein n=1 Tax=Parasediminibacterium sp. JCM 36343 TaxID=3374279 RepID=UPI00397D4E7B